MNWQDFLREQGASGETVAFALPAGLAALESGATLVPLGDFGLIRFSGEETLPFLHGQLSNDVKKIGEHGAQYATYSTPKGRMLTSLLLVQDGEDTLLVLPQTLQAAIQKRLSMYVLRSKTRASDANGERIMLGLAGPQAARLIEQVFGSLPATLQSQPVTGGKLVALSHDRYLLIVAPETATQHWQALTAAGAVAGCSEAWQLAEIRAGLVWVQPATQEEFVAQMANMELIGAVNFKKGCYPGQEIVARTQYLGKLKRRTIRVQSTVAMEPGDAVYSPEMNGQASGQIAAAAPNAAGNWEALAVVQLGSIAQGLHLQSDTGPVLTPLSLPYAIPELEAGAA